MNGVLDPVRGPLTGLSLLFDYIVLGWEDGILNQIDSLKFRRVSKAQIMEVVMAAQIWSGMKSLQGVYRAANVYLREYVDSPEPAAFPAGWGPDSDAFSAGLDMSTLELTDSDRTQLLGWYERTIGMVPQSVQFAIRYNPAFLKAYRLKWENAFRGALPKQMMPLFMLRNSAIDGRRDRGTTSFGDVRGNGLRRFDELRTEIPKTLTRKVPSGCVQCGRQRMPASPRFDVFEIAHGPLDSGTGQRGIRVSRAVSIARSTLPQGSRLIARGSRLAAGSLAARSLPRG